MKWNTGLGIEKKTSLNVTLYINLTFEMLKVYFFENQVQFKFQIQVGKNKW